MEDGYRNNPGVIQRESSAIEHSVFAGNCRKQALTRIDQLSREPALILPKGRLALSAMGADARRTAAEVLSDVDGQRHQSILVTALSSYHWLGSAKYS